MVISKVGDPRRERAGAWALMAPSRENEREARRWPACIDSLTKVPLHPPWNPLAGCTLGHVVAGTRLARVSDFCAFEPGVSLEL